MTTKTQTQKIEFSLNFGGFYHSEHSEYIDCKLEREGCRWQDVDYKKTDINYCNAYLNRLSEELEIDLTFIQLDSPISYNFTTDKILCSISENDFNTLLANYDTKELFNYKEEKDMFLQYLFNYILQYESFDFYDLEYETELKETNLIK